MSARLSLSLLAVAATVGLASLASNANAQEAAPGAPFGTRAQNVLAVDEIAGFFRETYSYPDANNSSETGLIRFGSHTGVLGLNETVRFGYHRFIAPDVSLGAGLHYLSRDIGLEIGSGNETTVGISPRIGFVFAATSAGALWFRVGFQYYHHSIGDNSSAWELGPGAELFYVVTPFDHFGITIGPVVELQLAGKESQTSQVCTGTGGCVSTSKDQNVRRYTFGLALGFLFDL
jgi:hypothetical protein